MKKTVFIMLLLLMVCCTTYAFAENEVLKKIFNMKDIINCGFIGFSIGAVGDLLGYMLKKK